jgi:hypothetical protein
VHTRDIALRRQYRRCLLRMARDSGSWLKVPFILWESADTPWTLLALAVIPGLQLLLPFYLFRLCTHRKGSTR